MTTSKRARAPSLESSCLPATRLCALAPGSDRQNLQADARFRIRSAAHAQTPAPHASVFSPEQCFENTTANPGSKRNKLCDCVHAVRCGPYFRGRLCMAVGAALRVCRWPMPAAVGAVLMARLAAAPAAPRRIVNVELKCNGLWQIWLSENDMETARRLRSAVQDTGHTYAW